MAKQMTERLPRDFHDCEPHQQRAWFERRNRQMAEARAYAASIDGQAEAAQRKVNAMHYDRGAYTDADIADAEAKAEALQAKVGQQITAEANSVVAADGWNLDTTKARRAEWNAAIKAGEATGRNGKVDARKLAVLQRRLGWTINELKVAVKLHGLA